MSRADATRVLICEDSPSYAQALRAFLEQGDELRVVGTCASGEAPPDAFGCFPCAAADSAGTRALSDTPSSAAYPVLQRGKLVMALPASEGIQQVAVADIGAFAARVVEDPERFAGREIDILLRSQPQWLLSGLRSAHMGEAPTLGRKERADLLPRYMEISPRLPILDRPGPAAVAGCALQAHRGLPRRARRVVLEQKRPSSWSCRGLAPWLETDCIG